MATVFVSGLALLAAAIRVMPLVLDPTLPWSVVAPFARAVAWLALEVAVAVGWPLGWGLATVEFVDRGEARVHALLGRSTFDVLRPLTAQSAAFLLLLAALSWLAARDAARPGRVLAELLESSRASCAEPGLPRTIPVPFLEARWLCGDQEPRLLMHPPQPRGAVLTARRAVISHDVRDVELEDVHLRVAIADVHVGSLAVRRLPALLTSASIHPAGRAASVSVMALMAAFAVVVLVFRRTLQHRVAAVALAVLASGAGFGVLRLVDRIGDVRTLPNELLLPLVPLAALIVAGGAIWTGRGRRAFGASRAFRAFRALRTKNAAAGERGEG